MPRKKKIAVPVSPATEPQTVAQILEKSPVAAILANRDARAEVEPDQTMAEQEAVSRFQRQREREQGVTEPPPVEVSNTEPPRPQTSWGDTVRGWTGHGKTGVHHVTAKIPVGEHGVMDVVGIKFDKGKHRTDEEKREMEAAGLNFRNDLESWIKPNRGGAFDETQDMARRFAERRRQAEAERER